LKLLQPAFNRKKGKTRIQIKNLKHFMGRSFHRGMDHEIKNYKTIVI